MQDLLAPEYYQTANSPLAMYWKHTARFLWEKESYHKQCFYGENVFTLHPQKKAGGGEEQCI